jgi:hypothetical protein
MSGTAVEHVEAQDLEARKHLNRVLVTADQLAAASMVLRSDLRNKVQDVRAIALTLDQHGLPVTIQNVNACFVVNGAVEFMTRLWTGLAMARGHHRVWVCDADPAKCTCTSPSSATEGRAHIQRGDDGMVYTATFSWEQATTAGLTESATYKKYPQDMLGWRALSRAVKRYAPDIVIGVGEAVSDTVPVARPRPPAFELAQDDDVVDGEIVEPGEDPGVTPAQMSAGAQAEGPPGHNSAAAPADPIEPERGRDNVGACSVVGGPAAPDPSGPDRAEVLARAVEQGKADALVLKKAREFAGELGVEGVDLPRKLDQVTDPRVIAKLAAWIG